MKLMISSTNFDFNKKLFLIILDMIFEHKINDGLNFTDSNEKPIYESEYMSCDEVIKKINSNYDWIKNTHHLNGLSQYIDYHIFENYFKKNSDINIELLLSKNEYFSYSIINYINIKKDFDILCLNYTKNNYFNDNFINYKPIINKCEIIKTNFNKYPTKAYCYIKYISEIGYNDKNEYSPYFYNMNYIHELFKHFEPYDNDEIHYFISNAGKHSELINFIFDTNTSYEILSNFDDNNEDDDEEDNEDIDGDEIEKNKNCIDYELYIGFILCILFFILYFS